MATKTKTNDSQDLIITVAQSWNTFANLSFTEITPQRVVLDVETNESADEDGHTISAAMSFHITNSCRLYSVMVKVKAAVGDLIPGDDLSIRIYNASNDGSGKPKPNSRASSTSDYVYFDLGGSGDAFEGWLNATWSSTIVLNATKTFESYFFVVLFPEAPAAPKWKLRSDAATGDDGYAWRGLANLVPVDYFLNVSLRPMGLTSAPTQIAMKVNGTAVANATGNAGWWNRTFTSAGSSAFFNVSSTWPITFNYTHIARFSRAISCATYFVVNQESSTAGWNITASVSYPNVGASQYSRTLNFTVPPYWNVLYLYRGLTLIPSGNYTWPGAGALNSYLFIDEPHGAGNGTWRVVCSDRNYVSQVLVYRGASSVAGSEVNITETLRVIASLQSYYTDGGGELALYDRDNATLTTWAKAPVNFWLNFSTFSPASHTSKNGRLTCEVVWGDGWHVGVKSNYVWLVYTTKVVPQAVSPQPYSGDVVILRAYYNDTFNDAGVVGAQVNVTIGSDGPYLMSDQGGGWYNYSWNSVGKPNQDYVLCYSANKSGYSHAIAYGTLSLYSRTQLDLSWTTQTIHYNHSIELRVNYTRLTGGTGGIAGATVNITFGTTTYNLVDLGNGTYTVLLNGTALDLGVHGFTVRAQKARYEAQQGTGVLTVDEEPTQITGDTVISVEVGTPFNITIVYTAQEGGPISGATFECRRNGSIYASFVVHYLGAGIYNLTFVFTPSGPTWYAVNITALRHGFQAKSHFCDVLVYFPAAATADPDSVICLIGDNLTIGVWYNETYSGAGIAGAMVNVTLGGTTYQLYDQGGGYYARELNSSLAGLSRGIQLGTIRASRYGYLSVMTSVTLTLWSKTQLVANWTLFTINYTESVVLEVNYTIVTPLGGGSVSGATVNITETGFFAELIEQPSGNYTVLLSGVVLDLGTHVLLVNASALGYFAPATLQIILVVRNEPTQIAGDAEISVRVDITFNITIVYTTQAGAPISGAIFECRRNGTIYASFVVHDLGAGWYNLTFVFTPSGPICYEMNITAFLHGYAAASHFCNVYVFFPTAISESPGQITALIGDNITIAVWYNETFTGFGVAGAVVNVTFAGTTYALYDLGDGYYAREFNTSLLALGRGVNLGGVQASRFGYSPASGSVTLVLWSKTRLVANWTVWTINYTKSVVLMVNYSVVTPFGEGGITAAFVNITESGFFAWLTDVGAGNYSILLRGTVLGVGYHLLVVNASKAGYYVAQTVSIMLLVEGEPTQITGQAPASVEGGAALLVNITYRTQGGDGIDGASFACLLNSAPFAFFVRYELGGGEYRLEFLLNVTGAPATFNITLTASRAGYWPQTFKALVLVTLRPTSCQVELPPTSIIVYAGEFVLRVNFTDGMGQGLAAALVAGNWSAIVATDYLNGTYMIRCLTAGAYARHWSVNLTLTLENYEVQWFVKDFYLVWPTTLTPTQGSYSVREYENETLIVDVTYTDTHGAIGVNNGTLWAVFQGSSHALAWVSGGVYRLSLNLTGVTPVNSTIDIFAQGEPYQQRSLQLSLRVLAKLIANLSVTLPSRLEEGTTDVPVTVQLRFLNGTPIVGAEVAVTVWIHHQNGTDLILDSQNVTTNTEGQYILMVSLPRYPSDFWANGQAPPELRAIARYRGCREIAAVTSTQASGQISQSPAAPNPWLPLLIQVLSFIIVVVVGAIIAWVAYAKLVKPRQARKLKAVESRGEVWAQRMMGLLDLRALFVMHAETGLPIFTYSFTGSELPSALLSGFISAVSAFHSELSGKSDRESQLRDIHYKDVHLSLREGKRILSAVILESSPSDEVTQSLTEFTRRFEQAYATDLSRFDGRIDIFEGADELVGKSFHSDLLVAHKCDKRPARGFPQRVYALAKSLARTDGRVYLPQLFVAAVEQFGAGKKFAIAHAIEKLRADGCLVPGNPESASAPSKPPEDPSAQG